MRSIEKRIERASKEERLEGWRPTLAKPNMPRPANELPQNVPDHMKLMLDLIVLAFQMDKTRIVTLMLNNDLSQMNFRFIQGVQGALHLDLTHNGKAAATEAMYLKTNQFHIAAVRLPRRADEVDRRRRLDAARQFDAACSLESVRRRSRTAPRDAASCSPVRAAAR